MKNKKEIIVNFLKQMASQDNRCTANPYFYVINTKVTKPAPSDNCDEIRYYDPENPDYSYKTIEEFEESLAEEGYDTKDIKAAILRVEEYGIRYEWEERGLFLTEDDAEAHLKINSYHYSKDAHTYVKHAWRSPKLKEFFEALFEEYGVDTGNWKG